MNAGSLRHLPVVGFVVANLMQSIDYQQIAKNVRFMPQFF